MGLMNRLKSFFKKTTDDTNSMHSHEDNQRFNSWLAGLMKKYGLSKEIEKLIFEMYENGATYEEMLAYAQEAYRERKEQVAQVSQDYADYKNGGRGSFNGHDGKYHYYKIPKDDGFEK